MSRIYWDSMLFIYWLEDNPQFVKRVSFIHSRMRERGDELITSAFAVGEILAGIHRRGASRRAAEVRQLLLNLISEALPFDENTIQHYAHIRGTLGVGAADAIHLACAAQGNTDLFLTNDKHLVGKFVPGIQFIASLETQFF